MNYREAYETLKGELHTIYDASEATAIAHEVLSFITGKSKMERLLERNSFLTTQEEQLFQELSSKLNTGVPMQYVLEESWFLGRKFFVSPAVLIPRPETEELVQWIVDDHESIKNEFSILDIGTGSGCIPISLKLSLDKAFVEALDISEEALVIARQNASSLQADVHFQRSDILNEKNWPLFPEYDVVVSNPPYIPESEKVNMHSNVKDHEPALALFTPTDDPLLFYRAIAAFGRQHLKPGGSIYCELHKDHATETGDLFVAAGYKVALRNDMHGNARMLRAKR